MRLFFFLIFLSGWNMHGNTQSLEELVLTEINAYRTKKHSVKQSENTLLSETSKQHATYMAEKNKLTHIQTNRKLRSHVDRIAASGLKFAITGENILYLTVEQEIQELSIDQLKELAHEIAEIWYNSSEHRSNLLNKRFSSSGIGWCYNRQENLLYVVQVFGGN